MKKSETATEVVSNFQYIVDDLIEKGIEKEQAIKMARQYSFTLSHRVGWIPDIESEVSFEFVKTKS